MKHIKITVMRDPTTHKIKFLKGFPFELTGILTEEEWNSAIEGINESCKEKVTFWSTLTNLSVILYLLKSQDCTFKELEETLKNLNNFYKQKHVHFCNPKKKQFMQLEVILTLNL